MKCVDYCVKAISASKMTQTPDTGASLDEIVGSLCFSTQHHPAVSHEGFCSGTEPSRGLSQTLSPQGRTVTFDWM